MIELVDIRKSYKTGTFEQTALDGVSMTFRDNEFVAILGPSGSGKTTLLNILGGLDHADDGDLLINGTSTKKYRSGDWDTYRNHRVGFIFQSYNLIPHQSILANVELALTLAGVSRAERRARATAELERVGLGEHLDKRPSQLSGGQMQRVAIARALVNDPDIVLADEPTGALDTETGLQVMDLLAQIASDRLVIMVTHNPELAETYANRIVRLSDGRITSDSNPYDPTADATSLVAAPGSPENSTAEKPKRERKASMSFLTALMLSFNNLMTKKGRTFLTAFAGSIGITGIAAILALSNGVNGYIAKVEQDTLSSYPLSITKSSTNLSGLFTTTKQDTESQSGGIGDGTTQGSDLIPESTVLTDMFAQIKSNDLSSLRTYLESGDSQIYSYVNTITYGYGVTPYVFKSDTSQGAVRLNPTTYSSSSSATSEAAASLGISMGGSGSFEELLDDQALLDSQYDVVAGRWATGTDECVLVLGKNGAISDYTLYNLGVLDPAQLKAMLEKVANSEKVDTPDTSVSLSYDDALALTFKVVSPSALYSKNAETGTWTDMTGDDAFMRAAADAGTTLHVVGVVRPNATTTSPALSQGVAYTHGLVTQLMSEAATSAIVTEQLANPDVDVFTGKTFEELKSQSGSTFDMSSMFTIDEDAIASAINVDTSAIEAAAASADTSSIAPTTSVASMLASMPQPDFSTISATLSTADQQSVAALGAQLVSGFLPYYFQQHPTASLTATTLASSDFSADMTSYLSTTTAQQEMAGIALIGGKTTSEQVSAIMKSYMANTFTPYLQKVMTQMVSEMSSAMASAMQASLSNMSAAMGSAISVDGNAFANAIHFNMTQDDLTSLLTSYANADSLTYDKNLEKLGYADVDHPSSIDIYPKDFANKEKVLSVIDSYNDEVRAAGKDDQVITYTDIMGSLISSVTDIVNMISYVLIAFVSISLVVSSIMIGIITYISVLERRKEIGILRAMGASKHNVASVFNAETVIEGLIAGVLAIVVVLLVSIPVNAVVLSIYKVADIMQLPWTAAFVLIGISVALTFMAGLIPSSAASRRDPVEALRSE